MCGVAQEVVSKEQEKHGTPVYTKPWHVTVKTVRALPPPQHTHTHLFDILKWITH